MSFLTHCQGQNGNRPARWLANRHGKGQGHRAATEDWDSDVSRSRENPPLPPPLLLKFTPHLKHVALNASNCLICSWKIRTFSPNMRRTWRESQESHTKGIQKVSTPGSLTEDKIPLLCSGKWNKCCNSMSYTPPKAHGLQPWKQCGRKMAIHSPVQNTPS